MTRIGVVVNPRSRQNERDPERATRFARRLGARGVVRAAHDHDELHRIAEDFRRDRVELLAILGGDGTNHVTLSAFARVYGAEPLPAIALLRGGTINTAANSMRVPRRSPEALLDELLARSHGERALREPLVAVERRLVRVDDDVCFLFGTGAIHGFIAEYTKEGARDAWSAARVLDRAVRDVMAGRPTPVAARWGGRVTVTSGGRERELGDRDWLAVGAGAIDQIGLGFTPFYRCAADPARVQLLAIHTSALGFVKRLPAIWAGRPMGAEHTHDELVEGAVLEARSGVVEYQCDGDVHEKRGHVSVGVGPRVRVIADRAPGPRPRPLDPRGAPSRDGEGEAPGSGAPSMAPMQRGRPSSSVLA